MLKFHPMSDDELSDFIARKLGWTPAPMGHGFYSRTPEGSPILFGPTHITQHFFEACEAGGVPGGCYRLEGRRWLHELHGVHGSFSGEDENFLRAGCLALAQILEAEEKRLPDLVAV